MTIAGDCDARFEPVRAAFADNFRLHDEPGAAVCVIVDGHRVVDLWGGHRDAERHRPWQPDTLVNVFSVGKAFMALLVAQLVGQGLLDVDQPAIDVWPEFGAGGKDDVTIRQLLTHQAGLPAVHRRLPPEAMYDWDLMTGELAADEPWWPPGDGHGYHVNTFGFLVGEVVRRITGHLPGSALRANITGPLEADVHLGLSPRHHHRAAEFLLLDGPPPEEQPPDLAGDALMIYNAYFNPSGFSGVGAVNSRAWRQAEIPSTNTHASARGVARVYAALAAGGTLDGVPIVERTALTDATTEQVYGYDRVLKRSNRFGLGFQLAQPERPLGPNPDAFGHFGAGGSLGFCDLDAGVAFGYVMNELGPRWQNPKNRALIDAVYASLS